MGPTAKQRTRVKLAKQDQTETDAVVVAFTTRDVAMATEMAREKQDRKKANELLVAVGKQDVSRVRRLLDAGHKPDAVESGTRPSGVAGMEDSFTALLLAFMRTNMVIARLLLIAGATVDLAMSEDKVTMLMLAAGKNMLEGARLLLEFGANPNVVNNFGGTALHSAAAHGHAAMTRLLLDHGAAPNVQTDHDRDSALHCAAGGGYNEVVRILLDANASVDLERNEGITPAKVALMNMHVATLALLLRHGAGAHRVAVLPDDVPGMNWTADESKRASEVISALKAHPSAVHLLADHGGISDKDRELDYNVSGWKCTHVLRALRQAGVDMWCGGGEGLNMLREQHSVDGAKLLGAELVGHTLQIRLRPSQFAACNDPLDLDRGARVAVYGLTSAAGLLLNGKRGKLGGPLGATRPDRYPVFFKGEKVFRQIKACNLRAITDPGRAAVAGHEVDALGSVVVRGVTGRNAPLNATFLLNRAHTTNSFPVFTHSTSLYPFHLYCGNNGRWFVGTTESMMKGEMMGAIMSIAASSSPLGLQWRECNAAGTKMEHFPNPAVTLGTPTWLTGSAPAPWIRLNATVAGFNQASHEHALVFCDGTQLHLRLDHLQFLDWDVLPRRRAAMLAPRTVMTFLMIMNRMRARQIPTEAPLTVRMRDWPAGTPVLRVMMRVWMRTDKEFEFFRDIMWPHVVAPLNLAVQGGREEDALQAARAAAATSGGGRSGGSGTMKQGEKRR